MCIWEGEVNDMLALEQVTASYGGSRVLFGVDIKAKKGEVTCLVGRNGVGKTTTVKSIMGLVSTPSGSITLDGKSIFKMPVYARAKSGIGYVPQGKGGDLSGGQQQQLAIARAIVSNPKVLILDEPTEGIQPSVIQEIGRTITKLKEYMAVLMVEQYLEFVLEVSDKCYVMEKGRIQMSGKTEDLDKKKLQEMLAM